MLILCGVERCGYRNKKWGNCENPFLSINENGSCNHIFKGTVVRRNAFAELDENALRNRVEFFDSEEESDDDDYISD